MNAPRNNRSETTNIGMSFILTLITWSVNADHDHVEISVCFSTKGISITSLSLVCLKSSHL